LQAYRLLRVAMSYLVNNPPQYDLLYNRNLPKDEHAYYG
jgi:hypothetical protein